MSNKIQIRRGNQADLPTLDAGELGFTLDTERLYIGNPLGSGNTLINFGDGGFDIGNGADGYITFYTGPNAIAGDNDLFWDRANNRLGVGTDTPTHKLTVDGYITPGTDNFHSLGTPSLRWESVYVGPSSIHITSIPEETGISYDWRIGIDQTTGNEGNFLVAQGEQIFFTIDSVTGDVSFSAGNELVIPGYLSIPETSLPPVSEPGFGKIYVDSSDSSLRFLDGSGGSFNLLTSGGSGNVDVTESADGYVSFFIAPGVIAGDNDFFWDREDHKLILSGTLGDSLETDGNIITNKDLIVGGTITNQDLSQSLQSITQALDGYGAGSGTISQAPSFTASDGYVAFFTDNEEIAGDNDFFWNRESHKLTLSGTLDDSIETTGNVKITEIGSSLAFTTDVESTVAFEQDGATTSISITLSSAPQEGSILLLGSAFPGPLFASTGINFISQTGVTWTQISEELSASTSNLASSLWYGVVGAGAGTTISLNVTNNAFSIQRHYVAEFSGLTDPFQSDNSVTTLVTGTSVNGPSVTNFDVGDVIFSMVPWNSTDDTGKSITSGTASNGDSVTVVEDGSISSNSAKIGLVRTDVTSDPGSFSHTINFSSSVTNDRHAVHTVVFSKEVVRTDFDALRLVNAESFEISLPPTASPVLNISDSDGDIFRVESDEVTVFGDINIAGAIRNSDLSQSFQSILQALDGYGSGGVSETTFQEFKSGQSEINNDILGALDGYTGGVSETTFQEFKSGQSEINNDILGALDGYGSGGGDVTKVGTPVNNQIGVWTGDGTLEGDSALTWDGSQFEIQTDTNTFSDGLLVENLNTGSNAAARIDIDSGDTGMLLIANTLARFGGAVGIFTKEAASRLRLVTQSPTRISLEPNSVEVLTVAETKNVGINTPFPIEPLTIGGQAVIAMAESDQPATLDGYGKIWVDTSGELNFVDDDGNNVQITDAGSVNASGGSGVSETTFQEFKSGQSEINNDILGALDGYSTGGGGVSETTFQEFKSGQSEINNDILGALDGYTGVTQTSGFTGADGYVAFFTGDGEIAGDNDFFYDRVNSELVLTGSSSPSLRIDGDLRFSEIGGAVSFATELELSIAVVQEATADTTSPNPQTISFSSAPQEGNVIFLSISADAGSVSSVSQSGVTWSLVDDRTSVSYKGFLYRGVVGAGASTDIVVTYGDSRTNISFYAVELSGVDTSVKQSSETGYSTSGTTVTSQDVTNFDVGDYVLTFFAFRANPFSEVVASATASNGDSVIIVENGGGVRTISSFTTNAITAFIYSEITSDPGTFSHTATISGSTTNGVAFSVVLAPASNTATDFNAVALTGINEMQISLPPSTNNNSILNITDSSGTNLLSVSEPGDVTVHNNLLVDGQVKNSILDQTFQDILGALDGYTGSGSPAGADGQIQYNNGGSFGGDADLLWDDVDKRLNIGTNLFITGTKIRALENRNGFTSIRVDNASTGSDADARFQAVSDSGVAVFAAYGSGNTGTLDSLSLGSAVDFSARNPALSRFFIGTTVAAPIHFYTDDIIAMTVDTNQDVGIGKTSPNSKLDVAGGFIAGTNGELDFTNDQILELRRDNTSPANPIYRLTNLRGTGTNVNAIQGFSGSGGTLAAPGLGVNGSIPLRIESKIYLGTGGTANGTTARIDFATDGTQSSTSTPGKIEFSTASSSTTSPSTVAMTIDSSQNVGIGRVATTNTLEVDGNASKTASGDWLANSDAKIKENVQPITNALSIINSLNPVGFSYTEEYKNKHNSVGDFVYYNFIAQDFQKVFPDSVQDSGEKTEAGEDILQIDTGPVKPYLVAAVQELHGMVQSQAQLIKELKRDIEELKKK